MFDTICAISSGNINQAISIIRIVGPEAISIIKKIFSGKIGKNKTIEYGFIIDQNKIKIDEVLVNFFIGADNFVGEDTIEINAHGGIVVTNRILELIIAHGARLAQPGEFSRRAYLNGKMSLIKAEAINDLIHSKTIKQQDLAINAFGNEKEQLINQFLKQLEYLIGLCEINIDYPEYDDIPILDNQEFNDQINDLKLKLSKIIQTSEANQVYIRPLKIAIVGKPNAGKSALLNAIINEDKSIVTNIAGTTRDIVESEITFNNMILKFQDTAGIHQSDNEIEQIGITKSWKALNEADVVLHVIDSTIGLNEIDQQIAMQIDQHHYLQLWNKADQINQFDPAKIYISAINKDLKQLQQALDHLFKVEDLDQKMIFNTRQLSCLKKAYSALINAAEAINNQLTYDVIILDLHQCWEALKEITGQIDKEDLLDSIFKNFCLGK